MKTHPDKNPGDADATTQFQKVSAAYDTLVRHLDRPSGMPSGHPRAHSHFHPFGYEDEDYDDDDDYDDDYFEDDYDDFYHESEYDDLGFYRCVHHYNLSFMGPHSSDGAQILVRGDAQGKV